MPEAVTEKEAEAGDVTFIGEGWMEMMGAYWTISVAGLLKVVPRALSALRRNCAPLSEVEVEARVRLAEFPPAISVQIPLMNRCHW